MGLCHFCLHFLEIWLCNKLFLCPKLFLCFKKTWKKFGTKKTVCTCVFYYIKCQKNKAKTTESKHFPIFFNKNIEKVWDIENFCNIAKFRKLRQKKNDRVPTFFYVKVFRWTGLILDLQYFSKYLGPSHFVTNARIKD